jgi:hypothetical protein
VANINQRRILSLQSASQGPFYAGIATADDGGTANYNALFLSVQKRLSSGLSVLANYTLSHCISDVIDSQIGSGGTSVAAVPGNRRQYRSNCGTSDQRQVFNLSAVAETPKFQNRSLRIFASGWQLSPIVKLKSPVFFTVTSGVDSALSGQTGETPNLVGDPYPAQQGPNRWINAAAFGPAPTGSYGNLGYNNLKGPGVFNMDVALSRTFPIWEKRTLQFRAEAFNLPNHVNFNTPVAALNSGTFGQIQAAADPRIVQLAMKLVF